MRKRSEFLSRYRNKEQAWNINGATLSGILINANCQLIEELLDMTPFTISNYHRDSRTDHQYIYDLLDGRIIEDLIIEWLKTKGRKVKRAGTDANGIIHRNKGKKITSDFDLFDTEIGKIEIQMSNQLRKIYHVKEYKGKRLLNEGGQLYFIILVNNTYFIIKTEDLKGLDIKYNPAWSKKCFWIETDNFFNMKDGNSNP